ncbi:MAG: hypothetical protein KDB80_04350 [Planctomycetes bacterium]|nr:hypothetical protein [Planctomycetota bacterium]
MLAWNDLGMHCIDPDFSVFSILPPANTINAQLVIDGELRSAADGYSLTYEAVADATGSINSTSVGKTNFWDYVFDLFGANLAPDQGLAGFDMPGAANQPQAMTFDTTWDWFHAEWIPLTPIDDAFQKNPYPLMRIVARNASNQVVASTVTVAPNSSELECSRCHGSHQSPAARPAAGWANDPDPLRDDRLNILRLHDDRHLGQTEYANALAAAGYNALGLYQTATTDGVSIFCARCHVTNAIAGTGVPGVTPLTEAMHGLHATVIDPKGGTLSDNPTRTACYVCHPGFDTQCLRGAMGKAIGDDGKFSMQCQSCHGDMADVGATGRVGWLDQPTCQNCHSGTATNNSGEIRFTSVFDGLGARRTPADPTFGTTPDVPAAGFSLFRFSTGHGGLQCSACHGPPHALYPTNFANDNVQSEMTQGHIGTIVDCSACHDNLEDDELVGPHGMHPVGQQWGANKHGDVVEQLGVAHCRTCHGADDSGTELSRALGDRVIVTQFGTREFFRGARIGCYNCHNGPNNDHSNPNGAPIVADLGVMTPSDVALPVALSATDPNSDPTELRIVSQPKHGVVAFDGTTATYTAATGFVGADSFTYAAWDGQRNSNLGTVSITVTAATCAGTAEEFGFGCTSSTGEFPRLSFEGCPGPGGTMTFQYSHGVPNVAAALLFSGNRAALEVDFGCDLRISSPAFALPMPTIGNDGTATKSITLSPTYQPVRLVFQAVTLDPTSTRLWTASNGLDVHIQ